MKNKLKIFFFFYDSRSGSTFLVNNLIKKLNVLVLPQSNFIIRLLNADKSIFVKKQNLVNFLYEEKKFYDLKINKKDLSSILTDINSIKTIIIDILNYFYKKNQGSYEYIGIKKGSYINNIDDIMTLFPNSKLFNIIRDGRAIYNSKKNAISSLYGKPFASNPYEAAITWNKKIKIMLQAELNYGAKMIIYEDMINNLEKIIDKIIEYLDITPNQIINEDTRYFISDLYNENLHRNIDEPPQKKNIDKWKNQLSNKEIYCFELLTKKNLKKFDYQIINKKHSFRNDFFTILYILNFYVIKIYKKIISIIKFNFIKNN